MTRFEKWRNEVYTVNNLLQDIICAVESEFGPCTVCPLEGDNRRCPSMIKRPYDDNLFSHDECLRAVRKWAKEEIKPRRKK